jgi:ATP-binding protein involved in chromosome partitioning
VKIMIPLSQGVASAHFGHCQEFALLDVDPVSGDIREESLLTPPPHEPGVLPRWIAEQGAELVLAGGMGQKARVILEKHKVQVMTGVPGRSPREVIQLWHRGELDEGGNFCEH